MQPADKRPVWARGHGEIIPAELRNDISLPPIFVCDLEVLTQLSRGVKFLLLVQQLCAMLKCDDQHVT